MTFESCFQGYIRQSLDLFLNSSVCTQHASGPESIRRPWGKYLFREFHMAAYQSNETVPHWCQQTHHLHITSHPNGILSNPPNKPAEEIQKLEKISLKNQSKEIGNFDMITELFLQLNFTNCVALVLTWQVLNSFHMKLNKLFPL